MFAVSTAVRLAAVSVGLCSVKAPSVFRYRVVFHNVSPMVVLLMTCTLVRCALPRFKVVGT